MINTLKINKYIRKFLIENKELVKIVKATQMFPILANQNTKFPFITYQRTAVFSSYQKDGLTEDKITLEIIAVSDDYTQSIEIASLIRDTLEMKRFHDSDITIYSMLLESVHEEFADNAYIQRLVFEIKAI